MQPRANLARGMCACAHTGPCGALLNVALPSGATQRSGGRRLRVADGYDDNNRGRTSLFKRDVLARLRINRGAVT